MLRGMDDDGMPCLNEWGFSMDDVILLPTLRALTAVSGVKWPSKVKQYLDGALDLSQCESYEASAVA